LSSYRHIIVLAPDNIPQEQADNQTLVTLLHLRDIAVAYGNPYSIVAEMHDDANREIAQVTKADDFIVSDRLVSLLLTQLAENQDLRPILIDLFDSAGAEVILKNASHYVTIGVPVTFSTVIEAAAQRGESAFGYRLVRHRDQPPTFGVTLNPPKAEHIIFESDDSIIVVAEE
jgi:hypothetical protein